jgi:hypothetical protein
MIMATPWKRNQFRTFYAKMKIRLGGKETVDIAQNDEFEYDGTILKYGGMEINTLALRGAIDKGLWASEDPDDDAAPQAVIPERNRAQSQSVNRDLSRVARVQGQALETDYEDENTILNVSDRRASGSGTKVLNVATDRAAPRILTAKDNQRRTPGGMVLDSDASDVQEGITVGRVRTKANIGRIDMTQSSSYDIANKLNDRIRDTGYTKTAKGTVGFIPSKEIMQEGVSIKTNVGKMKPGVDIGQEDDGQVIGKVRHSDKSHTEGIDIKDTSKRPAQKQVVTKAKPVAIDKNLSPKLRIALKLYPSFPRDWNFNGKLADRLAKVKEYGETPEFLEALYAAEGDQFRKTLKSEYADQFGG